MYVDSHVNSLNAKTLCKVYTFRIKLSYDLDNVLNWPMAGSFGGRGRGFSEVGANQSG